MKGKLKILITGASGFVGQHLLEDIDADKYEITIITRDPTKPMRVLPTNCKVVQADLLDVGSLIKAFKDQDVLINIAAEVRNLKKLADTNITGTHNIISAIKECNIKNVIHLSSVGVVGKPYSDSILNVNETTTCTPQIEYERTKFISENLFLESNKTNTYKLIILRPTNIYGEYHPFNALLRMMNHINTKKIVAYQKDAIVNYVYVKDLTYLICKLIESKNKYDIINVGNSESLENFFSIIATHLNVNLNTIKIPSIFIKFAQFLGIKKINTISNKVIYLDEKLSSFHQYTYGNQEGLKRTIEHYKKLNLIK